MYVRTEWGEGRIFLGGGRGQGQISDVEEQLLLKSTPVPHPGLKNVHTNSTTLFHFYLSIFCSHMVQVIKDLPTNLLAAGLIYTDTKT